METEQDEQVEDVEMRTEASTLYCFLDGNRSCGPSCMSYTTFPKELPHASELSGQQAHCVLLTSLERTGRSLVITTSLLVQKQRRAENRAADQKREQQFPHVPATARSPFPTEGF